MTRSYVCSKFDKVIAQQANCGVSQCFVLDLFSVICFFVYITVVNIVCVFKGPCARCIIEVVLQSRNVHTADLFYSASLPNPNINSPTSQHFTCQIGDC